MSDARLVSCSTAGGEFLSGAVWSGGRYAWRANESAVQILDVSTGRLIGSWRSASSCCVTAVDDVAGGLLAIGLVEAETHGRIVVFSPSKCRPLLDCAVPFPVAIIAPLSLAVSSLFPVRDTSNLHNLYLAVGAENGRVVVLDISFNPAAESCLTLTAQPTEVDGSRYAAGDRPFVSLNSTNVRTTSYAHSDFSGNLICRVPAAQAYVTALHYIPTLHYLCVGYRFGGFAVYRLSDGKLVTTEEEGRCYQPMLLLADGSSRCAVSHFIFVVPEEDDRFKFLLVCRGPEHLPVSESVRATMCIYQFEFDFDDALRSFCLKAENELPSKHVDRSSRVICARSLAEQKTGLPYRCYLVWETQYEHFAVTSVGIFDSIRWYSARQPPIATEPNQSGFFAVYSMNEIDSRMNETVLDVWIDASTVHDFHPFAVVSVEDYEADPNFFFQSFTFEARCLSTSTTGTISCLGRQERVLVDFANAGSNVFAKPIESVELCRHVRLCGMPHSADLAANHEILFDVCFENNLVSVICKYVSSTLPQTHGSDEVLYVADAEPVFLWAQATLSKMKGKAEELWGLITSTRVHFDRSSLSKITGELNLLHTRLGNLNLLFEAFLTRHSTPAGLQNIMLEHAPVLLLLQQFELIIWLLQHGFIPDRVSSDDKSRSLFEFPEDELVRRSHERRQKRAAISAGSSQALLIDAVYSGASYPPSCFMDVVKLFNEGDPSSAILKRQWVFYLLLDLADICQKPPIFTESWQLLLNSFAGTMQMPVTTSLETRGYHAVDSSNFEEAYILCSPGLRCRLAGETLRAIVDAGAELAKTAKSSKPIKLGGAAELSLAFLRSSRSLLSSAQDSITVMQTFVLNGLLVEAFEYQRQCSHTAVGFDLQTLDTLLRQLFIGCEQHQQFADLFQLPLSSVEEAALVRYLRQSKSPVASELLLAFYVLRNRCVEATRWHATASPDFNNNNNRSALFNFELIRSTLANTSLSLLPAVQRDLVQQQDRLPNRPAGSTRAAPAARTTRPQPVSVALHRSSARDASAMTRTSVICAVMDEITAARLPAMPDQPVAKRSDGAALLSTQPLGNKPHQQIYPPLPGHAGAQDMDVDISIDDGAEDLLAFDASPPMAFLGPPSTPSRTPLQSVKRSQRLFPEPAVVTDPTTPSQVQPRPNQLQTAFLPQSALPQFLLNSPAPVLRLGTPLRGNLEHLAPRTPSAVTTTVQPASILKKKRLSLARDSPSASPDPQNLLERGKMKTPPRRSRVAPPSTAKKVKFAAYDVESPLKFPQQPLADTAPITVPVRESVWEHERNLSTNSISEPMDLTEVARPGPVVVTPISSSRVGYGLSQLVVPESPVHEHPSYAASSVAARLDTDIDSMSRNTQSPSPPQAPIIDSSTMDVDTSTAPDIMSSSVDETKNYDDNVGAGGGFDSPLDPSTPAHVTTRAVVASAVDGVNSPSDSAVAPPPVPSVKSVASRSSAALSTPTRSFTPPLTRSQSAKKTPSALQVAVPAVDLTKAERSAPATPASVVRRGRPSTKNTPTRVVQSDSPISFLTVPDADNAVAEPAPERKTKVRKIPAAPRHTMSLRKK